MRHKQPVVVIQEDSSHLWKMTLFLFMFPLAMLTLPWLGLLFVLRWLWRTGDIGKYIVTTFTVTMLILMVVGAMFGTV